MWRQRSSATWLPARVGTCLLPRTNKRPKNGGRRGEFECCVSQVVIDEASVGDPTEVEKRLAIISALPALEITKDAESLTQAILAGGILPPRAVRGAAHVGVAAVHAVDYLLTWNCRHLANAQIARRLALVYERLGYWMPTSCTPEELMGA